jgi:alpha-L-arabinofuranosidase
MRNVEVCLHRDFAIGTTHPRLFGAFVEHLGRCVYGGIFEPGHPTADAKGFRRDVLALVRELAPTIICLAHRLEGAPPVSMVASRRRRSSHRWW